MKQTILKQGARWMGMTALAAVMTTTSFLAEAQSRYRLSSLESGTVVPVKLDTSLSSNNSSRGDSFTATLKTDDGESYNGLPAGTKVEGVIREVKAQRDKDPGVLDLDFRRLRLPDGHSYPIQGSLIGLDNKSVTRADDGRLIAKPGHRNDRITYAGIGAGAGLLVSVLTKRGVLGDVLLGGGLGYLFGSLQKGQNNVRDVALKPGTELGVRLDRRVTFADDNNDRRSDYRTSEDRRSSEDRRAEDRRNDEERRYHRTDRELNDRAADNVGDGQIGVLVGDQDVRFESTARPVNSKGVVLVPAKPVLSAAKVSYDYDAGRQTMRATGSGGTVRITAGSRVAIVNGTRRVVLQAPAQRLNGTLYVPVRFFSLVTGRTATYDAGSRTVLLMPQDDFIENNR